MATDQSLKLIIATFTRTTGQACIIIFDGTDWDVVAVY